MIDSTWKATLEASGATFAEDGLARFDAADRERAAVSEGDAVAVLSDLGAVQVAGGDAAQLLQGQLSVNVASIDLQTSRLAAWCTPRGRVQYLGRLLARDDGFHYVLPAAQVEACLQRLRLYVLRSAVTLADTRQTLGWLGLAGAAATRWLRASLGLGWPEPGQVVHAGDVSVIGLDPPRQRGLLVAPVPALVRLWPELTAWATPVGSAAWRLLDTEAGQPWLAPGLSEQFLPQMLNLDRLDGVSFDKGCYVGQEIVARTQYLGRLKRRMYKLRIATEAHLSPGDSLYVQAGDDGRGDHGAGTIVMASEDDKGGWVALAVIAIEDASGDRLRLHHVLGEPVRVEPLPYDVGAGGD